MILPEVLILLFAVILDLKLGEPPARVHPVVWIGKAISLAEKRRPAAASYQFTYGVVLVIGAGALGIAAFWGMNALRDWNLIAYIVVGAYLLKSTFAIRELRLAALRVFGALSSGQVEAARTFLTHLVSRKTETLNQELIVAATVESVAENVTDSVVAPLLFFLILGVPGALFYRAVNTLDAMIGYRGEYEYLGKAPARLDDALNYVPARLAGLLVVAASALAQANCARAWRIMVRDHALTESPNAGWTMSAMSGALDVQLEKIGHYRLGDAEHELAPWKILDAVNIIYLVVALTLSLLLIAEVLRYAHPA